MYVCICRAVTDVEVRGCIANGAGTVKEIARCCAAGTGCGSCVQTIVALLSAHTQEWGQPSATKRLTSIFPGQGRLAFGDNPAQPA